MKEVSELLDTKYKYKKNKAEIGASELVPIWIYIVINSEVENILTETELLQEFNIKQNSAYNEEGYQIVNLNYALEQLKKKDEDKKPVITGFYITPIVVNVKANSDVNPYELYYKVSSDPSEKESNPNIFGSIINTLNPFTK